MTDRETSHRASTRRATLALAIGGLVVALGAGEAVVRASGNVASWMEKNGFAYVRQATRFERLLVRPPNAVLAIQQAEFAFQIRTNREGLRDVDHPLEKESGELRIAVLGDSFTEGQGAAFEESFPQLLGRQLQADHLDRRVTILQAGSAGSDPVFETNLLEDRLLAYDPDWILLVLNASDPVDIRQRGGFDRDTVGMPPPRWEWLYARSHLARFMMIHGLGFDWIGLSPAESAQRGNAIVPTIREAARRIETLAGPDRRLVIVSHPNREELQEGKNSPEHARMLEALVADGHESIDVLPWLVTALPVEERTSIYWPADGHFTPAGYRLFAEAVHAKLAPAIAASPPVARDR